jgi:hypothetical protein
MNEFKDKELKCLQCNQKFVWTAGEQKFYDEKGLENEPKTCPTCREQRKQETAIEIECQACGTKGHIKTSDEDEQSIKNKAVICFECANKEKSEKN